MNSVQFIYRQFQNNWRVVIIAGLFFFTSYASFSQNDSDRYIKKLLSEFTEAGNDSLKIEKLSELSFYYSDYLGEKRMADSLSQKAIELAETNFRPGLLLLAYNRYIENGDPGLNLEKSKHYASEAIRLSKQLNNPKLEWLSRSNQVKVLLAAYEYEQAMASSYQALALSDAMNDIELKTRSYLLIGKSLEGNNQKIEAFRNYLNASSLAEKLKNKELLKSCFSSLSGFYNNNKFYDKAVEYKIKQIELIQASTHVDSAELMWGRYDLQAININSNSNRLNTESTQDILEFSIRNNLIRLKNYEIALFRSHLIEADKISELKDLYTIKYPEELKKLENGNPALFFRMKAYFSEEKQDLDSAYYYFTKAELLIQSDPNKILLSNFYQRFGQFLMRYDRKKEAIEKFEKAYDLAQEASYFEYMLSASKKLESLHAGLGDYKNAYSYSTLNKSLNDSINELTKNDQLLLMEIDHETKQREHAIEQEHIETHRRHNIQYTAITIIIIAMFILLLMLGSLKVPTWSIKMLGFFSFILFFEFIIMIADHKIYAATANEPWKILLIKIGLIAFLLPFHHWIEKKVILFLINQKLIDFNDIAPISVIRRRLFKRKQVADKKNNIESAEQANTE